MDPSPILSVIQPITFEIMLNINGLTIVDGLNFVTCEQTLKVSHMCTYPCTAIAVGPDRVSRSIGSWMLITVDTM